MARQKGIEPPASPLGGVRSILLSYWRRAYQTAQPPERTLYPNSCQLSTVWRIWNNTLQKNGVPWVVSGKFTKYHHTKHRTLSQSNMDHWGNVMQDYSLGADGFYH